MVPFTTVPFLSSIDTVSLFNFIKNLRIIKFIYKEKKRRIRTKQYIDVSTELRRIAEIEREEDKPDELHCDEKKLES